jgi:hypothetical protein
MDRIRIHVAAMPAMLRTILHDLLAAESDFLLVGHSTAGENPILGARRARADVLLAHDDGDDSDNWLEATFAERPLTILSIKPDGSAAVVLLTGQTMTLGSGSRSLSKAIRGEHGRWR